MRACDVCSKGGEIEERVAASYADTIIIAGYYPAQLNHRVKLINALSICFMVREIGFQMTQYGDVMQTPSQVASMVNHACFAGRAQNCRYLEILRIIQEAAIQKEIEMYGGGENIPD